MKVILLYKNDVTAIIIILLIPTSAYHFVLYCAKMHTSRILYYYYEFFCVERSIRVL